jgi:hypothetical protein
MNSHSLEPSSWTRDLVLTLAIALVVQVVSAWNAIGYWHPDQHHSIIEFATYELGITPEELMAREFAEQVRQTLQVYVFLVFYRAMDAIGLGDAYDAHTVLRLVTSLMTFALFNAIALRTFRDDPPFIRYSVLLLTNFTWTFPYIRTLFSSEVYGSLVFFSAIYLYERLREREREPTVSLWGAGVVGLLLSLAFFFRFQMGFATIGFGVYLLLVDARRYRTLTAIFVGFLVGTAVNVAFDSLYYGRFSFTPYSYWSINITDGRALGPKPVWHYLGILSISLAAPPLSFVLTFFAAKGAVMKWKDPYVLSAAVFLAAHSIVPHKEPRFLFPLLPVLPVVAGYGLRATCRFVREGYGWSQFSLATKALVGFSAAFNLALLAILTFVPVAQHISFSKIMNEYLQDDGPVTIVFFERTPYETPTSRNVATYYQHFKSPNVELRPARARPEFVFLLRSRPPATYFVTTRDRLLRHRLSEEMHGCQRLLVSSRFLLWLSQILEASNAPPLPEIWELYRCAPRVP